MPFGVEWADSAKLDFDDLIPMDAVMARMVVGSFPHDRWVRGRALSDASASSTDLRELENESVRVIYELFVFDETVRIISVRRD